MHVDWQLEIDAFSKPRDTWNKRTGNAKMCSTAGEDAEVDPEEVEPERVPPPRLEGNEVDDEKGSDCAMRSTSSSLALRIVSCA